MKTRHIILFLAVIACVVGCTSVRTISPSPLGAELRKSMNGRGVVDLVLTNRSNEYVIIDASGLPIEESIYGNLKVTTKAGEARYTGAYLIAIGPTKSPYILLAPGQCHSVEMDLDKWYEPKPSRGATVKYSNAIEFDSFATEAQAKSSLERLRRRNRPFSFTWYETNLLNLP